VRILFDNNTPRRLAEFLKAHEVTRSAQLNWQRLENGKLLAAAEDAGFDVLVTCDQDIRYQQNFADRKLAVVVLSSNHWPSLRPVAHRIAAALDFAQRGQVIIIDIATLRP